MGTNRAMATGKAGGSSTSKGPFLEFRCPHTRAPILQSSDPQYLHTHIHIPAHAHDDSITCTAAAAKKGEGPSPPPASQGKRGGWAGLVVGSVCNTTTVACLLVAAYVGWCSLGIHRVVRKRVWGTIYVVGWGRGGEEKGGQIPTVVMRFRSIRTPAIPHTHPSTHNSPTQLHRCTPSNTSRPPRRAPPRWTRCGPRAGASTCCAT